VPDLRAALSPSFARSLARKTAQTVAKKTLYVSGALAAWHRRRNRHALTVIMFHRVLSPRDPRWATSDPEYTLSDELFGQTLDFFKQHYNVVSLADVAAARAGERPLPERALLVTFDDGWSDNEEYAVPHLRRTGIPSVMFVAGAAVGRHEPFWQEQLIHAWRAGRLDAARATRLWRDAGPGEPPRFGGKDELDGLRAVIARLEQLDGARREPLVAGLADVLRDGVRYMVTPEQLKSLAAARVAIGAHGFSHEPLTKVDAAAELPRVRDLLAQHVATAPALSFPHGRFDPAVVERARKAGFPLLFTSVPELNPTAGRGPALLGRVGFTGETITDNGRFAPEKLALHLFRKPHATS
jgi:peptidoglycan/xylan/chitin deacetylase (PgdA/CDA1 family)